MVGLTDGSIDATMAPMKEMVISYLQVINGKAATHMLHIFVSEEQFKQYNKSLGRSIVS